MPPEGEAPNRRSVREPSEDLSTLESTASLLDAIHRGDEAARDRLVRRYWPRLRRWARGRVPRRARDLGDTEDLVQITFLRALDHLKDFDQTREGALLAYLRRVFLNLVRDRLRGAAARPERASLTDDLTDGATSPLDQAIGRELVERYEAALARLKEREREAVILRIEMGLTYSEVAAALEIEEPNTARMMVVRALDRVAEMLHE